jgi:hypothetical protein
LCEIGVLNKYLRDENTKDGMRLHNNMYLELNPQRLKELTYPQIDEGVVPSGKPPYDFKDTTMVPSNRTPSNTTGPAIAGSMKKDISEGKRRKMPMARTLSFVKGKGSISHNNRDFIANNVDKDRIEWNANYIQQPLKEAYDQLFGDIKQL